MYNMEQALLSMIRRDAHSPADGKMYGEMLSEMLRVKNSLQPSHLYVKIEPKNIGRRTGSSKRLFHIFWNLI